MSSAKNNAAENNFHIKTEIDSCGADIHHENVSMKYVVKNDPEHCIDFCNNVVNDRCNHVVENVVENVVDNVV